MGDILLGRGSSYALVANFYLILMEISPVYKKFARLATNLQVHATTLYLHEYLPLVTSLNRAMDTQTHLSLSGPSALVLPHPQSRQPSLISIGGYASFMLPFLQRYVLAVILRSHVHVDLSVRLFHFHSLPSTFTKFLLSMPQCMT